MSNRSNNQSVAAVMVAIIGISTFVGMDTVMKSLSIAEGAYNAMLWRTLLGLVLAGMLFFRKRRRWPNQSTLRLHVKRGVLTSLMAFLFFWGLIHVPLAEAIGLSFIAPLIALYLAAVLLKEKVGGRALLASIIGFSGALVIIGGKLGGDYGEKIGIGMAAILLSALLYAYNLILQRQQAMIADPTEIVFFQHATVGVVYLMLAPFLAVVPALELLPGFAAAAALGIISLMFLSWAYARAEANVLIPVEYTAFIWASLLGWLVFGEAVTSATLAGTALIVVACLMVARQKPGQADHVEATAI